MRIDVRAGPTESVFHLLGRYTLTATAAAVLFNVIPFTKE
jgi:hypothetical protein